LEHKHDSPTLFSTWGELRSKFREITADSAFWNLEAVAAWAWMDTDGIGEALVRSSLQIVPKVVAWLAVAAGICWLVWPATPRAVLPGTYASYPAGLSPDSRVLATISGTVSYKGTGAFQEIRLWDTRSGGELTTKPVDATGRLASFTPDNALVAVANKDGSRLYAIAPSVLRGTRPESLPIVAQWPDRAVKTFSPDGRWLALADTRLGEETTFLWDVAQRRDLRALQGAGGAALFTRDGRLVVVATKPLPNKPVTLKVWDVATGRELGTIPNVDAYNWALDPSGSSVAAGGRDAAGKWVLQVWQIEPFGMVGTVPDAIYPAFTPDGKTLAAAQSADPRFSAVVLWDVVARRERARVPMATSAMVMDDSILSVIPDADNRGVLVRVDGQDEVASMVRLDLASLQPRTLFTEPFYEVAVGSDGGIIVVKTRRGRDQIPWLIHIWDDPPRRSVATILLWSTLAITVGFGLARVVGIVRRSGGPDSATCRTFGRWNAIFGAILSIFGVGALVLLEVVVWGSDLLEDERPLVVYLHIDLVTMIVLNVLMVGSGIALTQDPPAGRTLAAVVAALKVTRLGLIAIAWWMMSDGTVSPLLLAGWPFLLAAAIYPLRFLWVFTHRSPRSELPFGTV
jgi:WD40 repeat protein